MFLSAETEFLHGGKLLGIEDWDSKSEGRLGQSIYEIWDGVALGLIHRGGSSGVYTLKLVPELAAATLF